MHLPPCMSDAPLLLQSHVAQESRSRLLVAVKDEGQEKSFAAGLKCSSDTLNFFRDVRPYDGGPLLNCFPYAVAVETVGCCVPR